MDSKNASALAGIRYDEKQNIFYPSTIEEIKRLIYFAQAENITVRTMGSQHSPPEAIYDRNHKQIHLSLAGELQKIDYIQPHETGEYAMVRVGAGCYLGINPKDKASNEKNSFIHQVDRAGFALPALGGITHQTIAGFLQTSSNGGSVQHGIADVIEEIELINGNGELCQFKKGESGFHAVGVGMGLFGVITHVVFKLPKKFLVKGIEENKLCEDSFLKKDSAGNFSKLDKALFEEHEYVHINWFSQKYVNRVTHWTAQKTSLEAPIEAYIHPLSSKFLNYTAAAFLMIITILDTLASNSLFIQMIKSILTKPFVPLNTNIAFCDVWYKALPLDDQVDVDGLMDNLYSEMWFPRNQINTVMKKLEDLLATDSEASGNLMIEIYAAKKSPFWISPSYDRDSFRVDLYWWRRNIGSSKKYFSRFWNVLLDVPGARLHWGKFLPTPGEKYGNTLFDIEFLRHAYPKLNEWLAFRELMDPKQLFVSDYWRKVFAIEDNPELRPN